MPYLSEFDCDESPVKIPLIALRDQLRGMKDRRQRDLLTSVVFDTEVVRPPGDDMMPQCKIMHNRDDWEADSFPATWTRVRLPVSLYVWFKCDDEAKDDFQLAREDYIIHLLSRLQGTVSGVTDATGIDTGVQWDFEFSDGTLVHVEHASPFDNLGFPFPTQHPYYCTRIDLLINAYL